MRKVLVGVAAFFVMAAAGWASPCTPGTLGSFESLTTGCSIGSAVFGNFSSSLSSTLMLSPGTSGFTTSLNLGALAGTTNTLSFTVTAPAGMEIGDFSAQVGGSAGATLTLTLSNNGSMISTLTANSGGGIVTVNFAGVTSLDVTGTLTVAAGTTGSGTLSLAPSVVPEPVTLSLLGIGLLVLGTVGRRMLAA